ncbi:MAG: phosphoribosylamine--glycine ligase [Bdellovibrionales bacterium RIFOXYC2_FULL_39_8]|nr:MAG: phosphoribosylamine--glycine ligase [Bdellovibrionales bacterium RIFOXYC2_FULL_39_8]
MRVVVLGSGGREFALAKKLSESPAVEKILVIPGNVGLLQINKVLLQAISIVDIAKIVQATIFFGADLVIVGPETPLALGVVDELERCGILILGPTKAASQLESSKAFAKNFMKKNKIPTAPFAIFQEEAAAHQYLNFCDMPEGVVVKADGLAGGKGVFVCKNAEEAHQAVYDLMANRKCAVSAEKIIIEKRLYGREISAFALCDGENFIPFGYATDYKQLCDGGQGPNTGGMGSMASHDWPSKKLRQRISDLVFAPTVEGMRKAQIPFKGILFAGLMIEEGDGVGEDTAELKVIEFNVRFGDPECQALMALYAGDILIPLVAAASGSLKFMDDGAVQFHHNQVAIHVVMASAGYPDIYDGGLLLNQKMTR